MKYFKIIIFLLISTSTLAQRSEMSESEISNYYLNRKKQSSKAITIQTNRLRNFVTSNTENIDSLFKLGEIFYNDYLEQYKPTIAFKQINQSAREDSLSYVYIKKYAYPHFKNSADSTLLYFKQVYALNPNYNLGTYFVIKQLEDYLNKVEDTICSNIENIGHDYIIPQWYFAAIHDDWKKQYHKDYLWEFNSSKWDVEYLTKKLSKLKEQSLYSSPEYNKTETYRFLWLRSFHEPILVSISKDLDKIVLKWKIGKGKSGYETKGIKRKGKKQLPHNAWEYFETLVKKADFFANPVDDDMVKLDGANWFLEYSGQKYNSRYNRFPNKDFETACLYLVELAGINYNKKSHANSGYFKENVFLNKNYEIVNEKELHETILLQLNQHIDKSHSETCSHCYDLVLIFNGKGKIQKLRYPPYDNWFLDRYAIFEDRHCLNPIKKSLKDLNLSYLRLTKPFRIYIDFDYNETAQKLE